jgi:ABC-type molybdate transport system substrate-binding protein
MPNKTPFFVIISLAIVIVIGLVVARLFFSEPLSLPDTTRQTDIQVVVAPSIKPWVEQAVQEYNQTHKNQVELITTDDLIPETQFTGNPQSTPPAAWLAEASFVVAMDNDMQFDDIQPVAGTSLAWGTFNIDQFNQGGGLNWDNLHQQATASDSRLKIVLASPQNSAAGLAALASAVAAQQNAQNVTAANVSSADSWLTETLQDSAQVTLAKPAESFATMGASVGDAGLLSRSAWQSAGLQNRPNFTISPAQPTITLDYPFAIWTGNRATPETQAAAQEFRDFLLSEAQQNALADFHFDRAGSSEPGNVEVDGQAALALYRWAERELR